MTPKSETNTDVLIIGAGPAGHMAGTWFARMGIENVRIIDKRSEQDFIGQADGLQSRTLEVFQSFGFGDRALKEANHMLELCFWGPNKEDGKIYRSGRIPDSVIGLSRFQQAVLHQKRVESWMRDSMNKYSKGSLKIERPTQALDLKVHDDNREYPVSIEVEHLTEDQGKVQQYGTGVANGLFRAFQGDGNSRKGGRKEIINAKYVIGCDGAHSWVRKNIGISMEGESTDYVWGVLDGIPVTDFPDIRNRCAIHSASHGSVMIIPREHSMVRLYIQLEETPRDPATGASDEADNNTDNKERQKNSIDRSKITPEFIMKNARNIFSPYDFDMVNIKWYTAYQIGQRVATNFSDKHNRVFITGDACHTHSPKAGQGMNVSMMDSYNLAWKIGHVLKGLGDPTSLLSTYTSERRKIAQELINYDHKLSRMFSGRPDVSGGGVNLSDFQAYFERGNEFASGTTVDYPSSDLVKKPHEECEQQYEEKDKISTKKYYSSFATKAAIGKRFDSAIVQTQSDTKPIHIADIMPSDGRWRIVFFCGDIVQNKLLLDELEEISSEMLKDDFFVKKYTPATSKLDSVIHTFLIHASKRKDLEWNDIPNAFRPRDHMNRMDYWKVYTDDASYHVPSGKAYEKYGIDPAKGAICVIRPDGYLSTVEEFSANTGLRAIERFFFKFMIEQNPSWASTGGGLNTKKEEEEWYGVSSYGSPVLAL